MTETLASLTAQMDEAARNLDFELARKLRDRISLIRGGALITEAEFANTDQLTRQKPGAMGLGTSQARVTPPENWIKPQRPDPMTKGRSRKR